jgi:hypothetical protein
MAALIALAAIFLPIAGAIVASIGVVSVAIHREEKSPILTIEAPDHLTRAGRWLNGMHVRRPPSTADADWDRSLV